MRQLYIPLSVLNRYIEENAVYKISLQIDKHTTVSLPAFLAFKLRNKIRSLLSARVWVEDAELPTEEGEKLVEFVYKHPDEGFRAVQAKLFGDEPLREIPSGTIRSMRVACRYVVTDLLMRGLYRFYERLKERGNEDKLLKLSKLERFGDKGERSGDKVVELLEGRPSLQSDARKKTINIFLPDQVYGIITNECPFTDFSSFLSYCILVEHEKEFDQITRRKYFGENGIVQRFEEDVIAWILNAEMEAEKPVIIEIRSERDLREALRQYLEQYSMETYGRNHNGFTLFEMARFADEYRLHRVFGADAMRCVNQVLREFEREGIVEYLEDPGVWVYTERDEEGGDN